MIARPPAIHAGPLSKYHFSLNQIQFADPARTVNVPHRGGVMKRDELARKLAREAHLPPAAARDEVDRLVHKILKSLRRGKPVEFPGVGRLVSPPVKRIPQ